jgi:GNAT superfamily N-acetyltransferase
MNADPKLRLARTTDIPDLTALISLSARTLQLGIYSAAQIDGAFDSSVFGVDRQLIEDDTYFVVEDETQLLGCGGWSKRSSLFGSDTGRQTPDALLNPEHDSARVRAFFIHPAWARRGLGHAILDACEKAIAQAGFQSIELVATLPGEPFYARFGYLGAERYEVPLRNGLNLPVVRMTKKPRA